MKGDFYEMRKKALFFILLTALTAGCSFNTAAPAANSESAGEAATEDEIEEYEAEYATLTKIEGNTVYFDGNETDKKYKVDKKFVSGLNDEGNEGREFMIVYHPSAAEEIADNTFLLKEAEIMASESLNY